MGWAGREKKKGRRKFSNFLHKHHLNKFYFEFQTKLKFGCYIDHMDWKGGSHPTTGVRLLLAGDRDVPTYVSAFRGLTCAPISKHDTWSTRLLAPWAGPSTSWSCRINKGFRRVIQ